jgi:hypothetical protein
MRRDIDPIKIIKILPLSNRPGGPPGGPSPWLARVKQALRTIRGAFTRLLATLQTHIARVRPASPVDYEGPVSSGQHKKNTEAHENTEGSLGPKTICRSDAEPSTAPTACPAEGFSQLERLGPRAVSAWFISMRESIMTAWQARRRRFDTMRHKVSGKAVHYGKRMRQTWGTQAGWRNQTERLVRPLTSAVRSLRRRHQRLEDELSSTHSIIQSQQREITELAFQLASVQTEIAAHTNTIDELTRQLNLLEAQVEQSLPATHGTTGQSGPSPQGRRGAAATKRNGPHEPGAQSRAEH